MRFERFEVPGLAHYSYLIACGGKAVIVDPKRDFDSYLEYAAKHGLKITYILETHIHADYASGALELAQATGAELWLSAHDEGEDYEYQFPHHAMKDGEWLTVGDVRIEAVYTPGHTPEHISFLIFDLKRSQAEPLLMLSGDFVFVGSLGRPDLLGEAAKRKLASQLFHSVHSRIADLGDGVEIHPAHGAGSMCGAGMSDRPQSTLGYERCCNSFFQEADESRFIQKILGNVPPFPDYYRRMKQVNSAGPAILHGIPGDRELTVSEVENAKASGAVLLDLRSPEAFGGGHIPGSFNIGAGTGLSTWAAWVLPYDLPIILIGDANTGYEQARRSLIRVGLDDIQGQLKGGAAAWVEAGKQQAHLPQESVEELHEKLRQGACVLDVRGDGEWTSGHIAGALHIMAGELEKHLHEVPKDAELHLICGSGYRSSVAASLLLRSGWRRITNVMGGMNAWNKLGLPVTAEAEPELTRSAG